MHEQVESAVRDRVAANIAQGEANAPSPLTSQHPAEFSVLPGGVTRFGKCHDLPPFGPPRECTMSMNMKNVTAWRLNGTLRAALNGTHRGRTATPRRTAKRYY